ncbi:hypothetical protein [Tsukamurella pulmonis]|uniref:hypothetical protein n=1 Tax=Tsukamurella pulmonis TaxID=47312 RepID=UPI000B10E652|nr:hypothetical protein [Tsukamurella pulmonis]
MEDELLTRALDALLAAEAGRFDPVPDSPELDARIVAALRNAPRPEREGTMVVNMHRA